MSETAKRGWLRLCIDVLLVTLVAGLAIGWWIDHQQKHKLEIEVGGAKYSMALSQIYEHILKDQGCTLGGGEGKYGQSVTKAGVVTYRFNLFDYMRTGKLPEGEAVPQTPNSQAPAPKLPSD